ncbi:MAG: type III pantothenate kinase [Proteobacteria bacterium]|nr:type III pantothenate kinase [Pseudomonadota bacterium]
MPRTTPTDWLIDLGNTRLKWARADRLAHEGVQAFAHEQRLGADALAAVFAPMFASLVAGDRVWIASVAGSAATASVEAALSRIGAKVERVATRAELAGVRIAYADPAHLGVDRFLALLGAYARARQAWLIVGVGTALTIDLLAADGSHLGGLIAPSPTLMRQALAQRAPHLPREGGRVLDFAADTDDALASGAILSARALIERSIRAARRTLGAAPTLLVAGGGADPLLEGWRVRAQRAPDLVLEGAAAYAAQAGGTPHAR